MVYAVIAVVNVVTRKLEGGRVPGIEPEELDDLRARAEQVEVLEQRVNDLETRLDFAERMLTAPTRGSIRGDQV